METRPGLKLPHVIHTGYSKAMSTWLQDLFRAQTHIFMRFKTQFFPPYANNFERGKEYYASFFVDAHPRQIIMESDEHLLLPDIHPQLEINITNQDLVKRISKRIHETLPAVKIIIVIRYQPDLILSRYMQYVIGGGSLPLDIFLDRLVFDNHNWVHYADYRFSLVHDRLNKVFGKDKVHTIVLEEFRNDPEKVLKALGNFLRVPLRTSPSLMRPRNVALSRYGCMLLRCINKILVKRKASFRNQGSTRCPYLIWALLRDLIRRFDRVFLRNPKYRFVLPPEKRESIHNIFKEDNRRLSDQLHSTTVKKVYADGPQLIRT